MWSMEISRTYPDIWNCYNQSVFVKYAWDQFQKSFQKNKPELGLISEKYLIYILVLEQAKYTYKGNLFYKKCSHSILI